jgi:hypothetical protein
MSSAIATVTLTVYSASLVLFSEAVAAIIA